MMVGGKEKEYERIEKIMIDVEEKYKGEKWCEMVGKDGEGNLVKKINKGIEYEDMKMIEEI